MMPNLALWSEFLSFVSCLPKQILFSLPFSTEENKKKHYEISCNDVKRGKNINSESIWKSLLDLVGDVLYLFPLQLMIRPFAGVGFLCKQSTEET